jgi:L-ascorbate metabolism protein UlaG (beta-lactamase superfamily)
MKRKLSVLIGAPIALLLAGTVVASPAPLEIPLGSAPVIDGTFDPLEWLDATTIAFTANAGAIDVRVHLVHDGEELYAAFEYPKYPDGELIMPEILIDADNEKEEDWEDDDWWFHVSAQNCDARGEYDNYGRCGLTRPAWLGRPNFAPGSASAPLDAIEIRIPLGMVGIASGEPFGLALTVDAWPSETRGYWPDDASIESPATWGEAVLVAGSDDASDVSTIEVRYLGANGWAVTIGQRMLIFDYQEDTDPAPPPRSERNLAHGYVDPDEFAGYDVYVLVTHSHFDHYDRAIHRWANQLDAVTYLFGWEAGTNPDHYYFDELREAASVNGIDVYTIYSHHSGVPEVAYLILVDDLVIYHNGDYKADYENDFAYLRTITDHIDVAFLIGHPVEDHQYFQQALLMNELFHLAIVFPMNREGEAYRCHEYAELLAEHGVTATVIVAEARGDVFVLER